MTRYDKHTEIIARLEARLRAAEEVVEAVRQHKCAIVVRREDGTTYALPSVGGDLNDALRTLDSA